MKNPQSPKPLPPKEDQNAMATPLSHTVGEGQGATAEPNTPSPFTEKGQGGEVLQNSPSNPNTPAPTPQERGQGVRAESIHLALLAHIPIGRNNAATGRELAAQLITTGHIPANQRDPARTVRQLVHDLRALGVPVCADSTDGFYLPQNPAELREYLKRLAHRLKELAEPFHALKHTYQDWQATQAGQTSTQPEHEPLSHIPEPYRQAYIHRLYGHGAAVPPPPHRLYGHGAAVPPPPHRLYGHGAAVPHALDAASHAASHPNTPSPFTERGQGGEVLQNSPSNPNTPSPFTERGQGVRATTPSPTPQERGQGVRATTPSPTPRERGQGGEGKPNIPQLIQTLLPRMPVKPTTTPEEAANWLQMELAKILRGKPYYIYLPLAYLNREGWNRGAIAQHIKDWLQHRKQQLKQQSTLFKEDTTDETH